MSEVTQIDESSAHSLETCIQAWRQRRPYPSADAGEVLADYHFSRGEFGVAAAAYAACEPATERIRAKRGWCLAMADRCEEAANFLTPENCGSSSAALAVLAATLAGGWDRSKLYCVSAQEAKARQAQVEELVQRALRDPHPDPLAFFAYMDIVEWYRDREVALAVAERAVSLYRYPAMNEWHARLLRLLRRPNDAAFNTLLARLPNDPWPSYVKEIFDSALALSRYDDANGALNLLEQKLRAEDDLRFDTRLTMLRAYVDLQRARDADPGAAGHGLTLAATAHRDLADDGRSQDLCLLAAKLRLALAVVAGDAVSIRESATAIIEAVWAADDPPDSPRYELMRVAGEMYEVDLGPGYNAPEVLAALSSQDQLKWQLLNALHAINYDEEVDEQPREFVALHGADWAPAWAAYDVADVLLCSQQPHARNLGRVLARYCLYSERRHGSHARAPSLEYDDLSVAQLGELVEGIVEEFGALAADAAQSGWLLVKELGSVLTRQKAYQPLMVVSDLVLARDPKVPDAVFYAALSRQEMKQLGAARPLYERLLQIDPNYSSAYWNVTLIHEAQGNAAAIGALLTALEERARDGAESWVKARDRARAALASARQQQATTDFRAFVSRELASFPDLRVTPVSASELSLLEAACLVALLRASELDHSTWTLASFAASSYPFEPTYRFRRALLDLAMKGIVRIADSTPMEAFVARDGSLRFHLDKVQWSISPRTLTLQSAIYDMARQDWPDHWRAYAEVLSRDLAIEECVAYIDYLAEQRQLDPPEQAESRALFRELLERCSVGKCWYYIYSGVQMANDYRTKYLVSRAQVSAMMLKKTRERGEMAIEKGWATSYSRIRALPRSYLSSALHDVLTGWGERAFEEPIRMLAHADRLSEAQ